jgi:hypothetical protein
MKVSNYLLFGTFVIIVSLQACKKDAKLPASNAEQLFASRQATTLSTTLSYTATTIAGSDNEGFVNGNGLAARFNGPWKVAGLDGYLYIADMRNNAIRKMKISDRLVTTLAGGTQGYADGIGMNAKFNMPYDIALGIDNNFYVSDAGNYKIRKVTRTGVVTTFAGTDSGYVDGPVSIAKFGFIGAIAVGKDGSVYVSEPYAYRIRKITHAGMVSTFAGTTNGDVDGSPSIAKLGFIQSLEFSTNGTLYIADASNAKIKTISSSGTVITFLGTTTGTADGDRAHAQFGYPCSIAFAPNGRIFVGDQGSGLLRLITPGPMVTTVAGREHMHGGEPSVDGVGRDITFSTLSDLILYDKALYIPGRHLIQKLTLPASY